MGNEPWAIRMQREAAKWLKDRRALWPYMTFLVLSLAAWILLEAFLTASTLKAVLIGVFKGIAVFAVVKILFEESSGKEDILEVLSAQKDALDGVVNQKICCQNVLQPLREAGISKLFPQRDAIRYGDIDFILSDDGLLRIFGVLPHDFVDILYGLEGGEDCRLRDILWRRIVEGKSVRLLMLDPYSSGGGLKRRVTQMEWEGFFQKLDNSLGDLAELVADAKGERARRRATETDAKAEGEHSGAAATGNEAKAGAPEAPVTVENAEGEERKKPAKECTPDVEIRLCRSFPTCHLILSKHHVLLQPSILHSELYDREKAIPMVKYAESDHPALFRDLNEHFDKVWQHDSITFDEYKKGREIGVYQALTGTNVQNIYMPRHDNKDFDPIKRMKFLIKNTKEILWVKGVSLYHTLGERGLIHATFLGKYKEIGNIRMLVLDPCCAQAQMRAFREHLIRYPESEQGYEGFRDKEGWTEGPLFTDTNASIKNGGELSRALNEERGAPANEPFSVRTFTSAPDAFIMITDDSVLFEPLHYGSKRPIYNTPKGPILSGDMPMIEFSKGDGSGVYDMLKESFQFVFDHFSEPVD